MDTTGCDNLKIRMFTTNLSASANKVEFDMDNTPLRFKSFLTVYHEGGKPVLLQSEFYVNKIIKTSTLKPSNVPLNMYDKGNIFYYEKNNNTGWEIAGGVALAGVIVAGVIIAVDKGTDIDMRH